MLQCSVTGDINLIQSLMSLDPYVLLSRNSHGLTVLHLSIIHQHFRLAEYLIHSGIDVTLTDNYRWTPLHDASLFCSSTLVEILLEYGSDILAKNDKGELPVDVAGDDTMEALLCDKMIEAGHKELVERYQCYWESETDKKKEKYVIEDVYEADKPSTIVRRSKLCIVEDSDKVENRAEPVSSVGGITSNREDSSFVVNTGSDSPSRPKEVASSTHSEFISYPGRARGGYKSELSPLREVVESSSNTSLLSSPTRVTSPVPKRKLSFAPCLTTSMFQDGTSSSAHQDKGLSRSQSYDTIGLRSPTYPSHSHRLNSELTRSSSDIMHLKRDKKDVILGEKSGGENAPIELLKMRPRKPSLVDVTRRKSREGGEEINRRSVSFQPEVLLQEFVTEGDSAKLKEIIVSGILEDVNKMSPAGLTALHQSALDGNLECAKTLILNGADVNSIDEDGWSPLHAAAASGHAETVRYFLLSGANPSLKNDRGQTPYDVAKRGIIRRMLFRASSGKTPDPSDDDISDEEFSSDDEEEEDQSHAGSDSEEEEEINFSDTEIQWTSGGRDESPLHQRDSTDSVFSEIQDPSQLAAALLKDREMSDSTSSYGSMTEQDVYRHEVAELEDSETSSVKTLCDEDTGGDTDQGFSTMDASSDCSNRRFLLSDDEGTSRDVLDVELTPGTYDYKFQEAILNCDVEAVVKLVKHKGDIDVNRVNKTSGITALHHGVLEENFALVQHLVCDFKCDINLQDIDGWTPLHAASAVGNIRIAQFLLDNGAKASVLNNNCEFPVDVTDEETMSDLLKKAMLGPSVGKLFKGIFR